MTLQRRARPRAPRKRKVFLYRYRKASIQASVVTPGGPVPDVDTIYLGFQSPRGRYGIFLTPDEALAAAALLTHAVWWEGQRGRRWPPR